MSDEPGSGEAVRRRLSPRAMPRPRPILVPDLAEVEAILARRDPLDTLAAVCSEALALPPPPTAVTDSEVDARLSELSREFDSRRLALAANAAEAAAVSAVVVSLGLGPLLAAVSRDRSSAAASPPSEPLPPDSSAFQRGRDDIPTVIVLSAPGRAEAKAGRPAAGATGKQIDGQLKILHTRDRVNYPSVDHRDYRIVNAVDDVHFMSATKRTEGSRAEVTAPANVARKRRLMEGKSNALVFGDNAAIITDAVEFDGSQSRGPHPSPRRINTKYRSEAATPAERAAERTRASVDDMVEIPARPGAAPAAGERSGMPASAKANVLGGLGPIIRDVASGSLKVGLRQGLGALTADLAATLFREVRAHMGSAVVVSPLARLRRACAEVLGRWADYIQTSLRGGLSSAMSALAEAIVEAFVSGAQLLVRLSREGAASLFGALGMLVSPPPGTTWRDRLHEALKIMTAGVAVAAGILVEEAIARALTGVPFADILAPLSVGLLTGLSTVFLCHLIDRADLFGAVARQRDRHVHRRILEDATQAADAAENTLSRFLAVDWERPGDAASEPI